jgi:hypothetical protein
LEFSVGARAKFFLGTSMEIEEEKFQVCLKTSVENRLIFVTEQDLDKSCGRNEAKFSNLDMYLDVGVLVLYVLGKITTV